MVELGQKMLGTEVLERLCWSQSSAARYLEQIVAFEEGATPEGIPHSCAGDVGFVYLLADHWCCNHLRGRETFFFRKSYFLPEDIDL